MPVPGHSSPKAFKQKEARCASGRWCCQAGSRLFLNLPAGLGSCSFFGCWMLCSLEPGPLEAWAPGLSLSHTGFQTFSRVGTAVVPQALTLVCMQGGGCEDRNLFAPGEENSCQGEDST